MTEYKNRSIDRGLAIIDVLMTSGRGVHLTEIAATTGLDRSTAYRLLQILVARQYVHRDAVTKRYFIKLGLRGKQWDGDSLAVAAGRITRALLGDLHRTVRHSISFATLTGAEIFQNKEFSSLHQATDGQRTQHKFLTSYATAAGKLMLANKSEADLHRTFEYFPFQPYTQKTIRNVASLKGQIALIRKRGYALNDRELNNKVCCVAVSVPVTRKLGDLALSISFPAHEVTQSGIDRLIDNMRDTGAKAASLLRSWSAPVIWDEPAPRLQ